jgi:hypothetical protein
MGHNDVRLAPGFVDPLWTTVIVEEIPRYSGEMFRNHTDLRRLVV